MNIKKTETRNAKGRTPAQVTFQQRVDAHQQIHALGALATAFVAESLASTDAAFAAEVRDRLKIDHAVHAKENARWGVDLAPGIETAGRCAENLDTVFLTARRVRERLQSLCAQIGAL